MFVMIPGPPSNISPSPVVGPSENNSTGPARISHSPMAAQGTVAGFFLTSLESYLLIYYYVLNLPLPCTQDKEATIEAIVQTRGSDL